MPVLVRRHPDMPAPLMRAPRVTPDLIRGPAFTPTAVNNEACVRPTPGQQAKFCRHNAIAPAAVRHPLTMTGASGKP